MRHETLNLQKRRERVGGISFVIDDQHFSHFFLFPLKFARQFYPSQRDKKAAEKRNILVRKHLNGVWNRPSFAAVTWDAKFRAPHGDRNARASEFGGDNTVFVGA